MTLYCVFYNGKSDIRKIFVLLEIEVENSEMRILKRTNSSLKDDVENVS